MKRENEMIIASDLIAIGALYELLAYFGRERLFGSNSDFKQ
jgi:hypothetical protein